MPLTNCYTPVWAAVEDDSASVPETPASQASSDSLSRRSDFRKLYMGVSVLGQPTGSAFVECGATKVLCAVYGPSPASASSEAYSFNTEGQLVCDFLYAPGARAATARPGGDDESFGGAVSVAERDAARLLQHSLKPAVLLDAFPKSVIKVHAFVLQAGGGELAAAICCASLALADAAVPMTGLVAACNTGAVPLPPTNVNGGADGIDGAGGKRKRGAAEGGGGVAWKRQQKEKGKGKGNSKGKADDDEAEEEAGGSGGAAGVGSPSPCVMLLDPSSEEESHCRGVLMLATAGGPPTVDKGGKSTGEAVTQLRLDGQFDKVVMGQALEVGRNGCALMHSHMARALVKHAEGSGAEAAAGLGEGSGADGDAAGV